MHVVIVEDEHAAVDRLRKLLYRIDPNIEIQKVFDCVQDTVDWFENHPEPDLLFLDVQLSDGISFEIFDSVSVHCPVVFTTAYDEYAIRAFELNSIDYLLKPVVHSKLDGAIQKYRQLKNVPINHADPNKEIHNLMTHLNNDVPTFKSHFLVKLGDSYHVIPCGDILFFHIDNQLVQMNTTSERKYIVEHSLDQIEKMVDPQRFFRINRQMIIAFDSINSIRTYFNSRLKLTLRHAFSKEIIVSRDKVSAFKSWLDR